MRRETYTSCNARHPALAPCIESLPARAAMLRDASACRRCWLRPLIGPPPSEVASAAHGGLGVLQLHRGDVVYRKDEPLHALFVVREGLVKSRALSYEGQDKITALHLPGEM
ncbi:MAG TPA: cyclic nucleotide-binding domain-containing protein, partial [Burkholderiales bacterium]|nr:cyclic nucleotide-binding domain-containing protein [Burkholderiales bacterium]